ncbi:fluoride efflux transporter CrcB [Ascidiimonas aurantiaca]|uniref:fluoride efflux transporter CrcB n=1 Tax=Ascidiimonas aurantiaca TaxID=1685432 RepID=UPI0030EBDE5D
MKYLLFVFIGGGAGSVARYLLGKLLNPALSGIPWGTFSANILGSLFIGFLLETATKDSFITQHHILLLAVGFCGGFTTFSTFAYENLSFLKSGDIFNFVIYSVLSLSISIIAVLGGVLLAKAC